MSNSGADYRGGVPADALDMSVNVGLRSFMLGVYNKMGLGLLLTAVIAYVVGAMAPAEIQRVLLTGPSGMAIAFAPLAILLISGFVMRNPSPLATNLVYWSVVSLIGISFGYIVIRYGAQPDGMMIVAKAMLTTAIAFGALSLYGYTTKQDMSGWGTFLIMGVVGLIIASLLNMFIFKSPMMHTIISIVGVLIFAALTAFDTQQLKRMYFAFEGNARALSVASTNGALSLYLNVINMFQFLLALMGGND